jgi:hypothetical protein
LRKLPATSMSCFRSTKSSFRLGLGLRSLNQRPLEPSTRRDPTTTRAVPPPPAPPPRCAWPSRPRPDKDRRPHRRNRPTRGPTFHRPETFFFHTLFFFFRSIHPHFVDLFSTVLLRNSTNITGTNPSTVTFFFTLSRQTELSFSSCIRPHTGQVFQRFFLRNFWPLSGTRTFPYFPPRL